MEVFSKKFKTTLIGLVVLLSAGVPLPAMSVEEVEGEIIVKGMKVGYFTKSYDGMNYDASNWQPMWWTDSAPNTPTPAAETAEDRCSDEYKKYADSACRSDAGHDLMDDTMMCSVQFGPRLESQRMLADPAILATLTKSAVKKGIKIADLVSEAWNLGTLIADLTRATNNTNCQNEAKVEHGVKNRVCDTIKDEREYLCSVEGE